MYKIHKYQIPCEVGMGESFEIKVPIGSSVLSVVEQNNNITIYILENINSERYFTLIFRYFCTGWIFKEQDVLGFKFLGTVILYDLMFHIFYTEKYFIEGENIMKDKLEKESLEAESISNQHVKLIDYVHGLEKQINSMKKREAKLVEGLQYLMKTLGKLKFTVDNATAYHAYKQMKKILDELGVTI